MPEKGSRNQWHDILTRRLDRDAVEKAQRERAQGREPASGRERGAGETGGKAGAVEAGEGAARPTPPRPSEELRAPTPPLPPAGPPPLMREPRPPMPALPGRDDVVDRTALPGRDDSIARTARPPAETRVVPEHPGAVPGPLEPPGSEHVGITTGWKAPTAGGPPGAAEARSGRRLGPDDAARSGRQHGPDDAARPVGRSSETSAVPLPREVRASAAVSAKLVAREMARQVSGREETRALRILRGEGDSGSGLALAGIAVFSAAAVFAGTYLWTQAARERGVLRTVERAARAPEEEEREEKRVGKREDRRGEDARGRPAAAPSRGASRRASSSVARLFSARTGPAPDRPQDAPGTRASTLALTTRRGPAVGSRVRGAEHTGGAGAQASDESTPIEELFGVPRVSARTPAEPAEPAAAEDGVPAFELASPVTLLRPGRGSRADEWVEISGPLFDGPRAPPGKTPPTPRPPSGARDERRR